MMELLEELGILGGLIAVQLVYAIYGILLGYVMTVGINPLFLIIILSLTTSLFFFPPSVYFERKQWPQKLSLKLLGQFMLISFAGVTLFQTLMLYGIKKTSPALGSVMPNLTPGFIFIIASLLRIEKVDMKCYYSKVKILGTLSCVAGSILMSSMYFKVSHHSQLNLKSLNKDMIIGTIYLLGGVIILSFNIILQAITLGDFPAPMSLNVITTFIGAIFTGIMQLVMEHRFVIGSPLMDVKNLTTFTIMGGILSGVCSSFQIWAMKKKGPIFVSTLYPVGTVFSIIISSFTLRQTITISSLCGMFLIFLGFYIVLWAKKKENILIRDDVERYTVYETKKPLLC